MNILFLTLLDFESIKERNIYTDLLREFISHGHKIFAISPSERRKGCKTHIIKEYDSVILKLRIGNMQKTGIVEKGLSMVAVEPLLVWAVARYFKDVKFDFVLYHTPPITVCKAVDYVKKRDGAKTYLLLKDIFPQNAVDMGMLVRHGLRGILYRSFRYKERRLYGLSDWIGCMSEANAEYVLNHNPEVAQDKVMICPNSIEPTDMVISEESRNRIRGKYGIPHDKIVFIYGGNLGKPQGVDFMLECLDSQLDNESAYFVIVGNGTEFKKAAEYVQGRKPKNVMLKKWIPKEDYDKLVAACDVGLIFLDYRFTIPNFPSRLLSYMQASLPVMSVTDTATDIGAVITGNGFGWWCASNDIKMFSLMITQICSCNDLKAKGKKGYCFLKEKYATEKCYKTIMKAFTPDGSNKMD